MEFALQINHLIDKICIILFVATLLFIGIHFVGFVLSGRFRERFIPKQD